MNLTRNQVYLKLLSKSWKAHLAKKPASAPTVISTFSGIGGSSRGYSMAGFRELAAVEWDEVAVETFKLNFPDVPVYVGDISKLSGAELMTIANIKKGELDILDGSPPCQGFSLSGPRMIDDPRNSLAKSFIRLVHELQPKIVVMENVKGMVIGKMRKLTKEMMDDMSSAGYRVRVKILNSVFFTVPQARERVIFIAVREDLGKEPVYPKPRQPILTVRDAWGDDEIPGLLAETYRDTKTNRLMEKLRPGTTLNKYHPKNHYFNWGRLSYEKPAPTLLRTSGGNKYHPLYNRPMTDREWMRLFTFPDEFQFYGNIISNRTQGMGNSVPPFLIKAIAETLRDNILEA